MDYSRSLVLACETVIAEMLPLLPEGMDTQVFDFGLHVNPEKLHHIIQEAINQVNGQYETILLGYGLCSQAMIGIQANGCTLILPRVDDCISIFLGSKEKYLAQLENEPGTYYLTKGWIEVGDTPFSEYDRVRESYSLETADRICKLMLANYKRLALINTGQYEMEQYRKYSQQQAEKFNLRYEEIPGSEVLVKKLLFGPWDDSFVIKKPGEVISYEDFYPASNHKPGTAS